MPVFVYVLLGIALLITLICLSKVRLLIVYEDSLKVYAKLWFLKYNLVPEKVEKPKKGKKNKKKSPPAKDQQLPSTKKEKSLPAKLWEIKAVLTSIIAKFLNKLHFKFIRLNVRVSCDNAAKTALVYSGVSQGITYIIEVLRNISNVDISSHSDVSVDTDFVSLRSELHCKIELYIRVLSLLCVGLYSLKEYIKFKSATFFPSASAS